jgi:hypothetical protein
MTPWCKVRMTLYSLHGGSHAKRYWLARCLLNRLSVSSVTPDHIADTLAPFSTLVVQGKLDSATLSYLWQPILSKLEQCSPELEALLMFIPLKT